MFFGCLYETLTKLEKVPPIVPTKVAIQSHLKAGSLNALLKSRIAAVKRDGGLAATQCAYFSSQRAVR